MTFTKQIQLILLPKGDILKPVSYYALCPYTQVVSEGRSPREAIDNWQYEASNFFHSKVKIPSQTRITSRKILYSESPNTNSPIYLLDFQSNKLPSITFSPTTKKTQDFKDSVNELGMLFDWCVPCTPVLEVEECIVREEDERFRISLTPNVIN